MIGVIAILGGGCDSGSSSNDTSAIDEQTCSIGFDIAQDYNVSDTYERSQERIADLYNGYGQSASPALAKAVRDWSAGMTQGDMDLLEQGTQEFIAACNDLA